MADSLDPMARAALTTTLTEKVAHLVSQRAGLAEERARLLALQRRVDRDLADCRATARLFEIEVEIPALDSESLLSMRDREMLEIERAQAEIAVMRRRIGTLGATRIIEQNANRVIHGDAAQGAPRVVPPSLASAPSPQGPPPLPSPAKRPSLMDFLTEQLRTAGSNGAKAAPLRELFERAYGETIHEKTVGMTLYRMSQKGLVTRKGHTWFLAEQPTGGSTENPGESPPGSEDMLL